MQGIPMIIECGACKARFRLDRKLLQGHLGARFRCRRCGGTIMVTTPEAPIARDPASAQLLFEEESVADAKPSNLVELQSLREAHRGRVPVNADNLFRSVPIPGPPIQAAEAHAHRIPAEPPVHRGEGFLNAPVHWSAKEAVVVLQEALKKPLSPPAPRKDVRRWHMFVERPSPVVMILVAAIGTAVGCLGLYYLLLGLTLVMKWMESRA